MPQKVRFVHLRVAMRWLVVLSVALFLVACPAPGEVTEEPPVAGEATLLPPEAVATEPIEAPVETPETQEPEVTDEATEEAETPEATEEAETPEATEETETPEMTEEAETPEATPDAETPEMAETETPEATDEAAEGEGAQTASVLAEAGQEVYQAECQECHGEQGEGVTAPAVIGEGANIDGFGDAQSLFNYIRQAMPLDAPGSLTEEQYRDVTAFLLLENGWVEEDTELSVETFEDIALE